LDYSVFSVGQYYQGNRSANLIAIPDFFSAFLGYKYLDDGTSTIYHYPYEIYGISIFCFAVGFIYFIREKQIHTYFFIALFLSTAGFYIFSGLHIYTRTGVFLIPFFVLYQAKGIVFLIERILYRLFHKEQAMNICFWVLSGVAIFYCATFNFGKFRNLEPDSGNPYELARNYLKNNAGHNDLIISALYNTMGGFYLGNLIREKNFNIYKNGRIENIYYVAPKAGESKIKLDMVYPIRKKNEFFPLDRFEPVISFENKGVRPSKVHIFKNKVEMDPLIEINETMLSLQEYFDEHGTACTTQTHEQGVRVKCNASNFTCIKLVFNLSNVEKNDLQFVLFHHINDKGTKTTSFASFKSLDQSLYNKNIRKKGQQFNPMADVYLPNNLVNNIDDADIYKENVDRIDVSLQKMGDGNKTLFCMSGKLFKGNSLINGIQVFNWKQETPEFN
jgi:hypothetical protein